MQEAIETIKINDVEYVRKDQINQKAEQFEDMDYCIVRTYSAGVFAGYVKSRNGKEGEIVNARRLWYWDGAASLSQLAIDGVSKPDKCKFPEAVSSILLTEIIEILPCTATSQKSIADVKIWKV